MQFAFGVKPQSWFVHVLSSKQIQSKQVKLPLVPKNKKTATIAIAAKVVGAFFMAFLLKKVVPNCTVLDSAPPQNSS